MTVRDLKLLLLCYKDTDELTIENNHIKIVGKFRNGETYEEYINSAGGLWEGGCGRAADGNFWESAAILIAINVIGKRGNKHERIFISWQKNR